MTSGLLVLNAGSSSVKFAAFALTHDGVDADAMLRGQIAGIGDEPRLRARRAGDGDPTDEPVPQIRDQRGAIDCILDWIRTRHDGLRWAGVGHRVVHGGERDRPARIDDTVLSELQRLCPLAPQHQPHNLAAIRAVQDAAPTLPQVACFDTSFHVAQPAVARMLPLPLHYRDQGLVRYGFHGLSYEYLASELRQRSQLPSRLVAAHLGNGASLCAMRDGRSVATTMGFSTLDGLLMGSRCGTLDPGVLLYLMREHGLDEAALSDLLYNRCGLLGVSGLSGDMRTLLESDAPQAQLAVDLFCYTVVRMLGAMAAVLEGLDGIVFTGGIGEHAAVVRARICQALGWLGVRLDEQANARNEACISAADSAVPVRVVEANEELAIAQHTHRLLGAAVQR